MSIKMEKGLTPQTCTQKIGDAEISYLFYGGDGPPLIFLHATGFLPWLWHPLARELADSYRIFAPYFCDHRDTDPENGGLDWITLAKDLCRFCETLHLEKPFLVGHSMGATVSMMANAADGLSAAGMVLIEPILLPPEFYKLQISVEQHPLASKAIRRTNFWRDRNEAMTYLRSRSLFQGWDEETLELYLRHGLSEQDGGFRLTCSPRREAALFMGGMQHDPWPLLSRVSCPVLILEGEKSESKGSVDLDRVRTLIPDCAHHRVRGAGHLIPMEKPREVTRLIREFFRPLQPGEEQAKTSHKEESALRKDRRKKFSPDAEPDIRSIEEHDPDESTDFARRRARSGRGPVRRNRIFEREEARMARTTKAPVKPAKAAAKAAAKTKTPVKAPAKAKVKAVAKPKAPAIAKTKATAKAKPAKAKK